MSSSVSGTSSVCLSKTSINLNCDFCNEPLPSRIKMLDCYHIFHENCFKQALSEPDSACVICKSKVTVISPETPQESSDSKREIEPNPLQDPKVQDSLADALVVVAAQNDFPQGVIHRFLHENFPFLSRGELLQITIVQASLATIVEKNGGSLSLSCAKKVVRQLFKITSPLVSSIKR